MAVPTPFPLESQKRGCLQSSPKAKKPSFMQVSWDLAPKGNRFRGRHETDTYNLGQNEWNFWTTPPPSFQLCQNGAFLLLRAFIIALGGEGG